MSQSQDFLEIIEGLKSQLQQLAERYKESRQQRAGEVRNGSSSAPNTGTNANNNQAAAANNASNSSANTLSGSVGQGGQNNPEDARKVQNLLNRHGIRPELSVDGVVGPKTIAAIRQFQQIKLGVADGLVEPGKNTWRALLGQNVPRVETPQPNNNNNNTAGNTANNTPQPPSPPNPNGHNPQGRSQPNLSNARAQELHRQSSNVNSPIRGSVGDGRAQNAAADVRIVQELLGMPITGVVTPQLIAAIRQFQTFIGGLGNDGIIDPRGNTMRYLVSYQKGLNDIPDIDPSRGYRMTHPEPGGRFTSPFGMRKLSSDAEARMHNGLDIAQNTGTPILAAGPGIATRSSYSGLSVEIDHQNGYRTIYAHLSSIGTLGQVQAGTVIGREGGSGPRGQNQFDSHLHFEVRIGNTPVDPMPFIKGVKLFPNRR